MKLNNLIIATLLSGLCMGSALAAPQNGLSINQGVPTSFEDLTYTTGPLAGQTFSYMGKGLNFGIDYQFALNDYLSLNPFYMISAESFKDKFGGSVGGGHNILGLQLRYWLDNGAFFGGHIANYTERRKDYPVSGTATSASTIGFGLVGGWENPDPNGGFYAMVQLDQATIKFPGADVKMTGARVCIGYRWKFN